MQTATRSKSRAVLKRLRSDFAYWASKCYRIRDKELHLVPLVLNHCQRVAEQTKAELRQRHGRVRLVVLKARQGGFTTYEQACNLHAIWSNPGTAVMTFADTRDKTDKVFQISRRAVDNFPAALLPRLGSASTRELSFPRMDSHFWTETARANNAGQSVTLRRLHGSEFAFWEEPFVTLRAAEPALEMPGTEIVLETTASAHGSEAHEFWNEAADGRNKYYQLFLPWWICDHEHYRMALDGDGEIEPTSEERRLIEAHGLDLEQIKWRRDATARMGTADFLNKYAEDPNSCWLSPGETFFDANTLRVLWDRRKRPVRTDRVSYYGWSGVVYVYGWQEGFPHEREKVVIGCDTAEGGGGDRSAWVARTYPSWRLLETFADNTIEPKALAALLNERGRKHGEALVCVEKNAHGITVLRDMRDVHKYPLTKLYHRTVFDQAAKKPTLKIGWATTGETKPLLLDGCRELFRACMDGHGDVPAEEALTDAFNTKRDEKGQAELNSRDMLVAEALAWQCRGYSYGSFGSFTEYV